MIAFEHPLLAPLYQVLAYQRQDSPEAISAANVVAQRLLQSPYLGQTYQDWHLVERAPGEWRLVQYAPGGQVFDRDPLLPFYRDALQEEPLHVPVDRFVLSPRPETLPIPNQPPSQAHLSADVTARAQALLEQVFQANPTAMGRLLSPSPTQLEQRQRLQVDALHPKDLQETLYRLLGPLHDASLRAYGIDYHTAPSYSTPDTTLYLLAHNGEEVAGLMKLGTSSGWGYGVGYICVAPGFRNQGLSQRLYQAAIDRCLADDKVLIRSDPGDQTPRQATLVYDRLILGSPVLHTTFHSPAEQGFKLLHDNGVPYGQWMEALKAACDAAVRTPEQRQAGDHVASQQQRNDWVERYGAAFEGLLKDLQPKPRRPRP